MMEFLNKNFQFIVIIILVLILFWERITGKTDNTQPQIVVVTDTTWKNFINKDPVNTQPIIIQNIPPSQQQIQNPIYIPDTSYKGLLRQYQSLLDKYISTNIQKDSIAIDTIGYVKTTDTVSNNKIIGRAWQYDLKYPIIKETITMPLKPKTQLYIGGGIQGNKTNLLSGAEVGILLKNKRDQIYGIKTGYGFNNQINYGISSYWKIRLGGK